MYFNPRLPGGRRRELFVAFCNHEPISIHASRVGGDETINAICVEDRISIHASRVGGDPSRRLPCECRSISIHASRVGGDQRAVERYIELLAFQSTPPGWEATFTSQKQWERYLISIHASRVGGDSVHHGERCAAAFQSTPPGWEATVDSIN